MIYIYKEVTLTVDLTMNTGINLVDKSMTTMQNTEISTI